MQPDDTEPMDRPRRTTPRRRRIAAFVDHEIGYRLLEKLIGNQEAIGYDLATAVTTEANGSMWWPGVAELCSQSDVPLYRYSNVWDAAELIDIDWYLLLSWKHILPPNLIQRPNFGVVNLHYSLLPEYRGVYPVNWAIIEGRDMTGVTYHILGEKIDTGRVVCRCEAPIRRSDTARTLQLRLDDIAFRLFDELLPRLLGEDVRPNDFEEFDAHLGTLKTRNDFLKSNELDLSRTYRGEDLINLLRGKTFFPDGTSLYFVDPESGRRIYVNVRLEEES